MVAVQASKRDVVRLLLELNADTTTIGNDAYDVSHTSDVELQSLLAEHRQRTVTTTCFCFLFSRHRRIVDSSCFGTKKKDDERNRLKVATMNHIRRDVGNRLWKSFAHANIIDLCIAMAPLDLPPFVLMCIVDWLPNYEPLFAPRAKMRLIVSIRNSIRNLKGQNC
jgi:hypothetical protein